MAGLIGAEMHDIVRPRALLTALQRKVGAQRKKEKQNWAMGAIVSNRSLIMRALRA
jgi:hypothetical protein